MPSITGKTKLLGVIGYPVGHSLSPVMHNAALQAMASDYAYVAFPIAPEDLTIAIAGLGASGVQGLSVTIPHKQVVMPLLTQITETARQVGAVNTLWRDGHGWQGTNTDVEGFLAPLLELKQDWSGRTAVILGYGGAARAVVVGLTQLGCPEIIVVGRSQEKLAQFANSWTDPKIKQALQVLPWEALSTVIPKASLLINSTPVGMAPHPKQSPLDQSLVEKLPPTAIAYDLIYTPRPTRFLQHAQERGLVTIDGAEMLVQQGAAALKIWLQQEVPVDVMRQALLHHLEKSA
ncbi:shikimate 5-dehydrogenase [Synechocystis sp. PCC 6803]|uniref:Shikimate dehydrogenase (NADP(+)) n=1 Tax=Synechocystis sp. (strain ATCC 27184 / PCC 6803 / Kazusa) TaxID=1111708 RepID=AROE_SYNY3|nr:MULTISPECIES: shikimate dehydrogenase [unclassified Synechocystis]P74591.1 RecName: Full=Shikimate dehydrogenase (NADP(+)); Short=SDH [Synechocystis sp. PCC 6803 substr. Kazusa]BAM53436.1 shikimate 5-dehydrogenase [Synechocystis sp. PCC 6803] [Bacillus subtilis BEST7613]AGF53249.1 shikimate 5-dehydrogenase [Synechocystis sp. PCC 6803]ALJ69116.1 shikimate dehydrogenase [Synechocystis sp. PCC 6803]AVP90985.1 shikimate dehydrogenase [Synechocystis sp. IPPAS B-1465]MBD2618110.1 shikimate dehyd